MTALSAPSSALIERHERLDASKRRQYSPPMNTDSVGPIASAAPFLLKSQDQQNKSKTALAAGPLPMPFVIFFDNCAIRH